MHSLSVTGISLINGTNENEQKVMDIMESTPDMPDWAYSLTATVLFLIGFFGFFLNLLVIILMCKDIQVSLVHFKNILL